MGRILRFAIVFVSTMSLASPLSFAGQHGGRGNSEKCARLATKARGIDSGKHMGKVLRKRAKIERKMEKAGCI